MQLISGYMGDFYHIKIILLPGVQTGKALCQFLPNPLCHYPGPDRNLS